MNNLAALPGPVTLESLARAYEAQAVELAALRERIEDLEDLRELEAAEARAGGKVSRPFDPVRDLGLTSEDLAAEARKVAGEENVR